MPVGSFKTKDGYMSINAHRDPHFRKFCTLIGRKDWINDSRFWTAHNRVKHRDTLLTAIRPIIKTRTSDEWNHLISEADILNAKVQTQLDLFDDS